MNPKIIPRKHRKHVLGIIKLYKEIAQDSTHLFQSWKEYLRWRLIGMEDGWMETNYKEYQALIWVMEIQDMVDHLQELEGTK